MPFDLGDYSNILDEGAVVEALKEGFKVVQRTIGILNMAPTIQQREKTWYMIPWLLERHDSSHFVYVPSARPILDEDGDLEVLQ